MGGIGVAPLSIGGAIVATERPHDQTVADVIRDLGLDFPIIFNRNAVMVLPAGVDKASGLRVALYDRGGRRSRNSFKYWPHTVGSECVPWPRV